jgi:hypothetical protein
VPSAYAELAQSAGDAVAFPTAPLPQTPPSRLTAS